MAKTTFSTSNALTKKVFDEKLFRDTVKASYFSRFMGDSAQALVHVKEQLTKQKGDNVTFGIRMRLAGSGVTSGQTLEGNEEKLTTYDYSLSLEQYRHAVRDNGALDRQRAMFSIDEESRAALQDWGAEKIDQLCFTAVETSPTQAFYGGSATSTATLTASDLITPALIDKCATWGKTGGGRSQTPLRPIKVNGKGYLVMVVHPDVGYDLRQDSTFAQANREAAERGKENPIFTGALGVWGGVAIHEHENCSISTTYGAGGNVAGAQCTLMGAQALVWAWGQRPSLVAKDFDFGNEHAYAWGFIARTGKPVFNSLDYGSVALYVARTNIAGA